MYTEANLNSQKEVLFEGFRIQVTVNVNKASEITIIILNKPICNPIRYEAVIIAMIAIMLEKAIINSVTLSPYLAGNVGIFAFL